MANWQPRRMAVQFSVVLLTSVIWKAFGQTDLSASRESICCSALESLYPNATHYPVSAEYQVESHNYWSFGNFVEPPCVFVPANAKQVSDAVKIFSRVKCKFSVRSGGHSPIPGNNGQDGAVLVATTELDVVEVKNGYVKVGPGNRWNDVYSETDKFGVVALGGRLGVVGVGGLLLGGGVSFQASQHGWACDTVANYEIVTADGRVRNVNSRSDPDLFWALKGGGNRFGIVTRFDLTTYPLGLVFAGTLTYLPSSWDAVLAQVDIFHKEEREPWSAIIVNYIDVNDLGSGTFVTIVMYYGLPVSSPPPVFQPFFDIPGLISNTVSLRNFSSFAYENGANIPPGALTQTWRTSTYKRSATLNKKFWEIYREEVDNLRASFPLSPGGLFTIAYQPVSTGMIAAGKRAGGNAFGLRTQDGPQLMAIITYSWLNPAESEARIAAVKRSIDRSEVAAKSAGKFIQFKYMNDAAGDQLIYQSYGKENHARLKRVRDRYDPNGVFQNLITGTFHL